MKRTQLALALSAFAVITVSDSSYAQYNFFPNNVTINSTIGGDEVVGYANLTAYSNKTNGTSPTFNLVAGGDTLGSILAYNSSTINVSGGATNSEVDAFNTSTVNLSSGAISGSLIAGDSSTVNFSGGSISGNLDAQNNSTVNVSGGSLLGAIQAYDNSNIRFFGTGLSDSLINGNVNGFSQYSLAGTLADGTNVTGESLFVLNGYSETITFNNSSSSVPESSSLALLGWLGLIGTVFLGRHNRRTVVKVANRQYPDSSSVSGV